MSYCHIFDQFPHNISITYNVFIYIINIYGFCLRAAYKTRLYITVKLCQGFKSIFWKLQRLQYNIPFDKSVVCGVNSADVRIQSSKTFCRIQTRRNEFSFLMIFFSARIIAPQFQSRLIIYYVQYYGYVLFPVYVNLILFLLIV